MKSNIHPICLRNASPGSNLSLLIHRSPAVILFLLYMVSQLAFMETSNQIQCIINTVYLLVFGIDNDNDKGWNYYHCCIPEEKQKKK